MKQRERLILGGLGGLTPLFAQLLIIDAKMIGTWVVNFNDPEIGGWALLIGYFIKGILLFCIGALWSYLHKSERNKLKIYQLGIVAPAIIAGLIHSNYSSNDNKKDLGRIQIVSSAYAQGTVSAQPYAARDTTGEFWSRIIDGFLSRDVVAQLKEEKAIEQIISNNEKYRKTIEKQQIETQQLTRKLENCKNGKDTDDSSRLKVMSLERQLKEAQKHASRLENEQQKVLDRLEACLREQEILRGRNAEGLATCRRELERLKNEQRRLLEELEACRREQERLGGGNAEELEACRRELGRLENERGRYFEELEGCRRKREEIERQYRNCLEAQSLESPREFRTVE